jgi:tRNA threonylcarbamoyladenosine biosynthesis protein TsaB
MGVALYDGARVLGEAVWTSGDRHTVELAPAVVEILRHCGAGVSDVEAVAVATGPGSFTGLRIGLALAKGLAMARRLPVIGVPTLDVLAAAQPVQQVPMAAVLQAGRGRLAVGWYHVESGSWLSDENITVLEITTLSQRIQRPTLVCGELTYDERHILARKHKNVILASPAQSLRRPSFLAELAWQRWRSGQVDDPVTMAPIYLHVGEPIPS